VSLTMSHFPPPPTIHIDTGLTVPVPPPAPTVFRAPLPASR